LAKGVHPGRGKRWHEGKVCTQTLRRENGMATAGGEHYRAASGKFERRPEEPGGKELLRGHEGRITPFLHELSKKER